MTTENEARVDNGPHSPTPIDREELKQLCAEASKPAEYPFKDHCQRATGAEVAKDAEIERLKAEIYELGRCGSPIDPNGQAILIISAFVSSFQSINDGPFELSKSSQGWDFSRLRDARDRAKQLLKTLNGDARHGAR